MRRFLALAFLLWLLVVTHAAGVDNAWPLNGGIDNIRYSPLSQIDRTNATRPQVAWTYDSHDAFKG